MGQMCIQNFLDTFPTQKLVPIQKSGIQNLKRRSWVTVVLNRRR